MNLRTAKLSIAAAVVALLVFLALHIGLTASAKSGLISKAGLVARVSSVKPAIASQADSALTVERVTVFPYGFEPESLTRPPGPFLLTIDNRAGTDDFSFILASDQNQPVHRDAILRGNSSTHKELGLAPGKYVLTETSHPGWVCTITVRPN